MSNQEFLIDQLARLEAEAEAAAGTGDLDRADEIDAACVAVALENDRRMEAAKQRFAEFDEDVQASGEQNAYETAGFEDPRMVYSCEYWEAAVGACECIVDFQS